MRLWLLLSLALLVQELASTNVALLAAYHAGKSPYLIAIIFLLATLLDLAIGYYAGKWVKSRFHGRFITRVEKAAARFEGYLGRRSEGVMLLLLGLVNFVYVNAFLAAWLTIPSAEALIWLAVGDLLWYALEWALILGATSISGSLTTELYIGVGGSLLVLLALRFISKWMGREEK